MYMKRRMTSVDRMTFQLLRPLSEQYISWMERMIKIDRIECTTMPYRMRLSAIIASDSRLGKIWQ